MEVCVNPGPGAPATRRAFLGTAAGIGLGSLGTVMIGSAQAEAQAARGADVVHDEIVDQYLAAVRRLQAAPSGEAARQMASGMRLLAAWGKNARIDETARARLDGAIRRNGRDRLLSKPFDIEAEVTLRGWKLPPGARAVASAADRADSLNQLRRAGVTSRWQELATQLDAAGLELDRKSSGPIVLVRQTTDCYGMRTFQLMLETQAFFYCTVLIAVPELCVITTASYVGWSWYVWWNGC
jgi:hypothetical protein